MARIVSSFSIVKIQSRKTISKKYIKKATVIVYFIFLYINDLKCSAISFCHNNNQRNIFSIWNSIRIYCYAHILCKNSSITLFKRVRKLFLSLYYKNSFNKKSNRNNGRSVLCFAGRFFYVFASFSKSFLVRSSNFFMTGSMNFWSSSLVRTFANSASVHVIRLLTKSFWKFLNWFTYSFASGSKPLILLSSRMNFLSPWCLILKSFHEAKSTSIAS